MQGRFLLLGLASRFFGVLFTMPNPWDIPPAAKVGNVSPDEIYVEVGKALSEWEMLEDARMDIF